MFQFILLVISFVCGIIVGFFSFLVKNKVLKVFLYLFVTILYVILFYIINSGEIHLYNKVSLIFGYCFYYYYYVKFNVKLKKNTRKIKKLWYP